MKHRQHDAISGEAMVAAAYLVGERDQLLLQRVTEVLIEFYNLGLWGAKGDYVWRSKTALEMATAAMKTGSITAELESSQDRHDLEEIARHPHFRVRFWRNDIPVDHADPASEVVSTHYADIDWVGPDGARVQILDPLDRDYETGAEGIFKE